MMMMMDVSRRILLRNTRITLSGKRYAHLRTCQKSSYASSKAELTGMLYQIIRLFHKSSYASSKTELTGVLYQSTRLLVIPLYMNLNDVSSGLSFYDGMLSNHLNLKLFYIMLLGYYKILRNKGAKNIIEYEYRFYGVYIH